MDTRKLFALLDRINFLQALNEHLHPRKHCLPHWSLWGPWNLWVSCKIGQHKCNFIYFVFTWNSIQGWRAWESFDCHVLELNSVEWICCVVWCWVEEPGWHPSGLEMCGWIYRNIFAVFFSWLHPKWILKVFFILYIILYHLPLALTVFFGRFFPDVFFRLSEVSMSFPGLQYLVDCPWLLRCRAGLFSKINTNIFMICHSPAKVGIGERCCRGAFVDFVMHYMTRSVLTYALAGLSGANFSPAVTFAWLRSNYMIVFLLWAMVSHPRKKIFGTCWDKCFATVFTFRYGSGCLLARNWEGCKLNFGPWSVSQCRVWPNLIDVIENVGFCACLKWLNLQLSSKDRRMEHLNFFGHVSS